MCYPWLHVGPQLRGYSNPHPNLLEHLGKTGSFQDANRPGCQPLSSLHWTPCDSAPDPQQVSVSDFPGDNLIVLNRGWNLHGGNSDWYLTRNRVAGLSVDSFPNDRNIKNHHPACTITISLMFCVNQKCKNACRQRISTPLHLRSNAACFSPKVPEVVPRDLVLRKRPNMAPWRWLGRATSRKIWDKKLLEIILTWVCPKIGGFPPKSSILIGFSIINHPFWGTPIVGNPHMIFSDLLDTLSSLSP